MASVSGATSSLGNTSLRGFGGMASGIDRDSIIEQMTLGTTTKINNQKKAMTSLNWRQEAFRSISDKILKLQDNYMSYTSNMNLKTTSLFARNQITAVGNASTSKYVTATGSSNMVDYMSIMGVKNLAKAASMTSAQKGSGSITTSIKDADMLDMDKEVYYTSDLRGKKLTFVTDDKSAPAVSFTFPSSYEDENGKKVTLDYVHQENGQLHTAESLKNVLNTALEHSEVKMRDKDGNSIKISEAIQFDVDANGKLQIQTAAENSGLKETNYSISTSSSALEALGFDKAAWEASEDSNVPVDPDKPIGPEQPSAQEPQKKKSISIADFNSRVSSEGKTLNESAIQGHSALEYVSKQTFSISFAGQTKNVQILTEKDIEALKTEGLTSENILGKINNNLAKAFGKNEVTDATGTKVEYNVEASFDGGVLTFKTGDLANKNSNQSLTVHISNEEVRENFNLVNGASNKLSLDGSLEDNYRRLGFADISELEAKLGEKFEINGVEIEGVTKDTTIQELLDKINSTKAAGVKATYLSATNQFALVGTETGEGKSITLGGAAAAIFGVDSQGYKDDGTLTGAVGKETQGENAQILVSYGDGINTVVESASNTFKLDGMNVTVSGTFNTGFDKDGSFNEGVDFDSSLAVTFNAKTDVEGTTEKVKKFIEEYNALIKEINTQVSTKPVRSYGALTDEQKDEMTEKEIENWEKKAKEGLLFNDSTMRDLSMDMQGITVRLMNSGVKPEELEKIGITVSDDYHNGGELVFDEEKFKEAMESDSELVSNVIAGGGKVSKGLAQIVEETLTPYATRYASKNKGLNGTGKGSYGRLVEEAGSELIPLSVKNNFIADRLKEMETNLEKLKERLSVEQDRYISQFSTMESLINQMNSQAGWLAGLTA